MQHSRHHRAQAGPTDNRDSREYSESIVDTIREPLLVLGADLRVLSANRSFYRMFKVKPQDTEGRFIFDLGNRHGTSPGCARLLEKSLHKSIAFDDFEVEHEFPVIRAATMLLNARKIPGRIELGGYEFSSPSRISPNAGKWKRRSNGEQGALPNTRLSRRSHGLYNRNYFSEQMAHLARISLDRRPSASFS